jgi:hypothetical protein
MLSQSALNTDVPRELAVEVMSCFIVPGPPHPPRIIAVKTAVAINVLIIILNLISANIILRD